MTSRRRSDSELELESIRAKSKLLKPLVTVKRFFAMVGILATLQFVANLPSFSTMLGAVFIAIAIKTAENHRMR